MKINNWIKRIQDRVKWKEVAEKTKTFRQWIVVHEEEEEEEVEEEGLIQTRWLVSGVRLKKVWT